MILRLLLVCIRFWELYCAVCMGRKGWLPFNILPGLIVPPDSAFDLHYLPKEGIGQKCEEPHPKPNI